MISIPAKAIKEPSLYIPITIKLKKKVKKDHQRELKLSYKYQSELGNKRPMT